MRTLWSGCQDSVVLGITHLSVIRGICLLEGRGPHSVRDAQLLFKQAHHAQSTHLTPLTLCEFVPPPSPPPSPPFLCSAFTLCPDVPVPLLQVHQHGSESPQNARDDTALCPAHVTLPVMPGHAQQQDPPAVPPHTSPQRGTRLRWQAYCHREFWMLFI